MSLFITFEGPEGGGKSTQIQTIAAWLRHQHYPILVTREPGGTSVGDQIRHIVLTPENQKLTPEAEILLYSAARAQLVREQISPALAQGIIVLCDRYADSTLAYQGYGRRLPLAPLEAITHFATGGLQPDLTLLLDIDVTRGLQRRRAAADEWNRLDSEQLSFHERVREGYHTLAAANPTRWHIIQADALIDDVALAITQVISDRLVAAGLKPQKRYL